MSAIENMSEEQLRNLDFHRKNYSIWKVGYDCIENHLPAIVEALVYMRDRGIKSPDIVFGWGGLADEKSKEMGISVEKPGGIRKTPPELMKGILEVEEEVLKQLSEAFDKEDLMYGYFSVHNGFPLFTARPTSEDNFTGVDPYINSGTYLRHPTAFKVNFISPLCVNAAWKDEGPTGIPAMKDKYLNLNADDAFKLLVKYAKPKKAFVLTSAGHVYDQDQQRIPRIEIIDENTIGGYIREHKIEGGMVPKVQNIAELTNTVQGSIEIPILYPDGLVDEYLTDGGTGTLFSRGYHIKKSHGNNLEEMDQIYAILEESFNAELADHFGDNVDQWFTRREINNKGVVLMASLKGEDTKGIPYIHKLGVVEEAQNNGLAKYLLRHAYETNIDWLDTLKFFTRTRYDNPAKVKLWDPEFNNRVLMHNVAAEKGVPIPKEGLPVFTGEGNGWKVYAVGLTMDEFQKCYDKAIHMPDDFKRSET
tara:strand:- start:1517 stop:2947 length:1431 start_codon:yes stop_codon:yes gene_type:complete